MERDESARRIVGKLFEIRVKATGVKEAVDRAKVPLYMSLGVSLSFAVTFSLVDLLNLYSDHCFSRAVPLVASSRQIGLVPHGNQAHFSKRRATVRARALRAGATRGRYARYHLSAWADSFSCLGAGADRQGRSGRAHARGIV